MAILTLPLVTWLVCGSLKFGVNFLRFGRGAFQRVGHGGFPSNHTAIVSSLAWIFILSGDWKIAALAIGMLMIYIFDATGLRREIGVHATEINKLTGAQLREVIGHMPVDIVGGLITGLAVAMAYWLTGLVS